MNEFPYLHVTASQLEAGDIVHVGPLPTTYRKVAGVKPDGAGRIDVTFFSGGEPEPEPSWHPDGNELVELSVHGTNPTRAAAQAERLARWELSKAAAEAFMGQVWLERPPLGTPVDKQLVEFERELQGLVDIHLSHLILGGEPFVELRRSLAGPDDGPVWQAIEKAGIDPLYIGSHIHYRAIGDGRVEQVLRHAAPGEAVRYVTVWNG